VVFLKDEGKVYREPFEATLPYQVFSILFSPTSKITRTDNNALIHQYGALSVRVVFLKNEGKVYRELFEARLSFRVFPVLTRALLFINSLCDLPPLEVSLKKEENRNHSTPLVALKIYIHLVKEVLPIAET